MTPIHGATHLQLEAAHVASLETPDELAHALISSLGD